MNHADTQRRLSQIKASIVRLQALKGLHEARCLLIPRGVSEPALYAQGQRDIVAGIAQQIANLNAEADALTVQPELAL